METLDLLRQGGVVALVGAVLLAGFRVAEKWLDRRRNGNNNSSNPTVRTDPLLLAAFDRNTVAFQGLQEALSDIRVAIATQDGSIREVGAKVDALHRHRQGGGV